MVMYHYKLTAKEVGDLTPFQINEMAKTARTMNGEKQPSGYTEETDGEKNPELIEKFNKSMGIK